jgi:hypothetical protein
MGSIYLSNLNITQSNLGGSCSFNGSQLGAIGSMESSRGGRLSGP